MNLNLRMDAIMLTMLVRMRLTCCFLPFYHKEKHLTSVYNCVCYTADMLLASSWSHDVFTVTREMLTAVARDRWNLSNFAFRNEMYRLPNVQLTLTREYS